MENIRLPKSIKSRPYWVQYISTYIVFFLAMFVGKIKVRGRSNIPNEGPLVLVSNHFAYFDPFLLVYAIKKPIDFIMQKELGIEPQFLFAPMIYGAILTDRNKVGPSTVKESMKTVKKGKILGIFCFPMIIEYGTSSIYFLLHYNFLVFKASKATQNS